MKVWQGYGTEHSMNLVMIGRFDEATEAETALDVIKQAIAVVQTEENEGRLVVGDPVDRYSDEMLRAVSELRMHSIGPRELEQFLYDVTVERHGDRIVFRTDEVEVQAFVKLLLTHGAKVEMFSAHDYPGDDV